MSAAAALSVEDVCFRYHKSDAPAVAGVSLSCAAGRHGCIVGPNGAGKSTLLRLALGLLRPASGRVRLWDREVTDWHRRELARRVGVVSQDRPPDFPVTVREFVEMGRHPHLRPWQALGAADRDAVARALGQADLQTLAARPISALSGGELQRAKLARALAQEPSLLLLDEPTAHLDLGHEMQIFTLVDDLVRNRGLAVLTVTHNLDLAGRFADHLVLLADGHAVAAGTPGEVLRPGPLRRAFGWSVEVVDLGDLGRRVVPRAPEPGR